MRIQVIFGVLLIHTHVVMGSLFQDHVVCRFNQIKPCYVAVGQRLHLQMPLEDAFDLMTTSLILRYRKTQSSPPTPRLPRWQFVNDNKTMILTSAERNDSGTYTLNTFDGDGKEKGSYTLQVNIEGSLFQDHVVCTFNQIKPCYVAVGQRLHLQIPWEDGFDLKTTSLILRYRKTQRSPPTPHLPRWQFVNDNKTMILTSAERNDSGTYTLNIFDVDGRSKDSYTLQVNIEAQVSSVKVSYSCLSSGVMKVTCSADGDNLHFSWTSDFNTLPQLKNGTSTVTLEQDHQGNITCHVENHVSRDHDTAELHQCPGSLFQDHDVCRFNQIKPCYVAVGQRLYLQMPLEDGFDLKTTGLILTYRKTQSSPPTPHLPKWQFVNDNKTMILASAERNDSGTYTLNIFDDRDGRSKGSYTLQVNIEAQVSSVNVSYSCLFSGVMKVTCSADGDNLHFSWTSDFNTLPKLENGTSTVTLEQDHQGNITCHVENHFSLDHDTAELHQCPGSLFQDHVCRFNQMNPCYVAVGQRLYLQMPLEDGFDLMTTSLILTYRKTQSSPLTPRLPRWQFVNDNKTMILTSAERSDSGTYTLNIFHVDGRSKGSYTLQVNIEAQVSSVKVSYSCLFSGVRRVFCSADGDNLHFSWTSESITRLEDDNKTLVLDKSHREKFTCLVENHVSHEYNSINLPTCIDFMIVFVWLFEVIILLSVLVGSLYIYPRIYRKQRTPERPGSSVTLNKD